MAFSLGCGIFIVKQLASDPCIVRHRVNADINIHIAIFHLRWQQLGFRERKTQADTWRRTANLILQLCPQHQRRVLVQGNHEGAVAVLRVKRGGFKHRRYTLQNRRDLRP